jgi:hypothetical protein
MNTVIQGKSQRSGFETLPAGAWEPPARDCDLRFLLFDSLILLATLQNRLSPVLKSVLDMSHELVRDSSVDDAMIVRQREVNH